MQSVLEASAILGLFLKEPGHARVSEAIAAGAGACTVNLAEVAGRCFRAGMPREVVEKLLTELPIARVDLDFPLAFQAGEIEPVTMRYKLSLGDRACLALGCRENLPVVTADRQWGIIGPLLGIAVRQIR